jgi:cell division protein FtsB
VRVRWDRVGRIGLLVVLVAVVGLYVQHTLAYFSTRSQADEQLAIVNRLREDNRVLERQQSQLSDPATIQRDARALGMVKAGERPYVITGPRDH